MIIDLIKYWGEKELYYVAELTSKIIHSMQVDDSVELWTKEAKSGEHNGLYDLLDDLCGYWDWDKNKISISTANPWANHLYYKVTCNHNTHPAVNFNIDDPVAPTWTGEKYYGMFIGRADSNRIHAIHTHKKFKHTAMGLTSFHTDLFNFMSYPDLVNYYMQSDQTYAEMISIKPYSDIDIVRTSPITPPHNSEGWAAVYERIAIEVVCEVSTLPGNPEMSEKLIRPIYHRRPFLLISAPYNLKFLREYGYKTFDGIIPEDYDQLQGFARVDRVFTILADLIDSGRIHTIIGECQEILDHNYNLLLADCRMHKENFKNVKK